MQRPLRRQPPPSQARHLETHLLLRRVPLLETRLEPQWEAALRLPLLQSLPVLLRATLRPLAPLHLCTTAPSLTPRLGR